MKTCVTQIVFVSGTGDTGSRGCNFMRARSVRILWRKQQRPLQVMAGASSEYQASNVAYRACWPDGRKEQASSPA